jgi:5-methylcytosine-specific restriction endonuclease McrA
MAKVFAKQFYNSKRWRKTQEIYKQMRYGICERCGKPNGIIVHHKIHLNETNITDDNITLNFDNLELLCIDCHNKEHMGKYQSTQKGLLFNEKGELMKVRQ